MSFLPKDILWYIADNYLTNIEIHSLMACCKTLQSVLKSHRRLNVYYIPYEFWNPLIKRLSGFDNGDYDDVTYEGDECCVHIGKSSVLMKFLPVSEKVYREYR